MVRLRHVASIAAYCIFAVILSSFVFEAIVEGDISSRMETRPVPFVRVLGIEAAVIFLLLFDSKGFFKK